MKNLFRKIGLLALFITFYLFSFSNVFAKNDPGTGVAESGKASDLGPDPASFNYIETIFENTLGIILSLAGVAIFVMLIMAGFKFLTAGGNPEQAKSAKGTMTWAVIGLIVMLAVWFVMKLIEELTGVNVTEFEIPKSGASLPQ